MNNDEAVNTATHFVGIGASAGGLEAIEAFFKSMPSDSGCAFIVVQHLSPDYKSLMAELLSKRTQMPVKRAEEGMLVEANHVYLIPPNHDLRIFSGRLTLEEQTRDGGINLPIDIFLTSLAEDQGDKSVAIILSGTGSDGARGVRAIKEKLGLVMVQDENSAAFDGMPRAVIATGMVDYVLTPEEMPGQLISYIQHPYVKKTEKKEVLFDEEGDISRIFSMLRGKTGVDFTYYKPSTMVRRIERRMSINQFLNLRDYVRYLETHVEEIDHLQRDLLIGVTNFFRDSQVFKQLKSVWLSDYFEQIQSRSIRIWVSGCSTGEEAYTLAMVCSEVRSRFPHIEDVKIFATDVDKEAIATAGSGVYPESILADVPQDYLNKYFTKKDNNYVVSRSIREMVVFALHNVIKDPPFTNIDLVSCRNLLIYLQPMLQQRVMELFNYSLKPGGLLLLGSSESTGDMNEYFEQVHPKWRVYRSRGRRKKEVLSNQTINFQGAGRVLRPANPLDPHTPHYEVSVDEQVLERLVNGLSGRFIPLTLVVNEQFELIYSVGSPTPYLKFPSGRVITDIGKLAHPDLSIPITTGIHRLLKHQKDVDYNSIKVNITDSVQEQVNMHLTLLPTKKNQLQFIAILIETVSRISKDQPDQVSQAFDVGEATQQRITDLEQELQYTRENLQATVEELETSNEELQATNEELLASNEELQSTNEELQSVNEELYTVNAEHQTKITELTTVNNDLDNLLNNISVGTLFLDDNLEIRRFTPDVTRVLRIIEQDVGRPFDDLAHDFVDMDLDRLVKEVNQTHESIERETKDQAGNHYFVHIIPYQIAPNMFEGVLLTFVNINTVKKMQDALILSEERNKLAQQATQTGSWDWDLNTNRLTWSETIERMFGFEPGSFDNSYETFLASVHQDDRQLVREKIQNSIDNPNNSYEVKHRIVWPNGHIRWMYEHGKILVDNFQRPIRMVGIVRDVTERHHAEEELIRSEHLFRSTLENLDMIAIQLDREGRIIFVNDFYLNLTSWSRESLMHQKWLDLCVPQIEHLDMKKMLSNLYSGRKPVLTNYENHVLHQNGEKTLVYWNNTVIYDVDSRPMGLSAIGQPVVPE